MAHGVSLTVNKLISCRGKEWLGDGRGMAGREVTRADPVLRFLLHVYILCSFRITHHYSDPCENMVYT